MTLMPGTMIVPLRADSHGVLRVGSTRVAFESVVRAFRQGATPEAVGEKFPSLALAEIYLVTAYYLQHEDEVEAWLHEQDSLAESVREQVERDFPAHNLRARLQARLHAGRTP